MVMMEDIKAVLVILFIPENSKYADSMIELFNQTIEFLNPSFRI